MIQVTARYTPSTNAVHRLHPKTSRHTLYAWYHAVHRSTTVVHPDTPKTLRNTACIVSSGTPQHQCSTLGYTQEHCGTHCMHSTIRYTPNTTAVHPVTLQKIAAHLYSEYHAVHPEHHNNTPDYTFRTSQHTLYTQYYAVHPEYHYSTPSYTQKHCGTHCIHSTMRYTPSTTTVNPATPRNIVAHLYSEYHAVHPEHHEDVAEHGQDRKHEQQQCPEVVRADNCRPDRRRQHI